MKAMPTPKVKTQIKKTGDHMRFKYAEEWLDHATRALTEIFRESGYVVPATRTLLSFPIDGLVAPRKKRPYRGQCLARAWTENDLNIIMITPIQRDSLGVLSVLMHELAHSVDDCQSYHGPEFKKICGHVGLKFYREDDYPGEELLLKLKRIALELGEFPSLKLCKNVLKTELNCTY